MYLYVGSNVTERKMGENLMMPQELRNGIWVLIYKLKFGITGEIISLVCFVFQMYPSAKKAWCEDTKDQPFTFLYWAHTPLALPPATELRVVDKLRGNTRSTSISISNLLPSTLPRTLSLGANTRTLTQPQFLWDWGEGSRQPLQTKPRH